MINAALNLLPGAVGQQRPQIIPAVVAPNTAQTPQPKSFSDPLFVTSPTNTDSFWTVLHWTADHGGTLPQAGAACALFYDSNGALRCVWWDGVYTPPPTASWLGLNGNSSVGNGPLTFWTGLGLTWDRQAIIQPAAAPLTNIATALANGVTDVVFSIEDSTYNTGVAFPTSGPAIAAYTEYFVSTVQAIEAAHPGVCRYEIINESWGFYSGGQATASTYAALVLAVLQACQAAGFDLTRIYPMVKDQSWPAAMLTAQPALAALIKGWSVHPYGSPPPGFATTTTQGIASVPYFRSQLTVGQDNILISEIGVRDFTIDGVGSTSEETALTAALAQKWTRQILRAAQQMHDAGWLTALLWYNRNDAGWSTNLAGGALTNVGTALSQFPLDAEQFVTSGYSVQDDAWLAVTGDPYLFGDAVQLTGGKVHLFRVRIDKRSFAQNITIYLDTAGATLTAGQCFVGVYDLLGNLFDSTSSDLLSGTDLATKFAGAAGRVTIELAGDNYKPGFYFMAIGANGTTMPKFRGKLAGDQAIIGASGGMPTRAMVSTASFTTSLPASINYSTGVSRLSSGILAALH